MFASIGRRSGAALFAAALIGGAALALPSTPLQAAQSHGWRGGIDGNNVSLVRHAGGYFAESTPGSWTEFAADGRPIHAFDETGRDAFTVTIVDRPRNTTIVLDLRRRQIRAGGFLKPMRLLYPITDVEARAPGGGRADQGGGDSGWDRFGLREVEVGPIWSQRHAERRCTDKAGEIGADWTGQWRTVRPGQMSVCQMRRRAQGGGSPGGWNPRDGGDVDVGPIWNQADAVVKCTAKARELGVEWSGNWTSRGGSSVCGMRGRSMNGPGGGRGSNLEVGPIWNQADAENKCPAKAREVRGEWTGQWWTTQPGRMSVCEIRFR